jgi:dTDP-4-amino-4,6-dideoxygalactose transaminase
MFQPSALKSPVDSSKLTLMSIELPDWPPTWPEIQAAIEECLQSGDWGRYHSPICSVLENRLAQIHQATCARLCSSGTAALEVALRASKVCPNDEVILSAFDFAGNFRTIELLGAKPVLVDLAEDSLGLDPKQLESAASEQVKAVIVSHLYGTIAEVQTIQKICEDRGWILIEDACQVAGLQINGRPAGSFGDFGTLSFGGSKLISAGNGGAILCNSNRMAARLGPILDRPGDTFPLAPLAAAAIGPQLDRLEEMNQIRQTTVDFIVKELNPKLVNWQWHSGSSASSYYKVAWSAKTAEERARVISEASRSGLPIGDGFRSTSSCSDRRCRKPVSTERADRLSETLFVLDHRALLLEPTQLASCLEELHG